MISRDAFSGKPYYPISQYYKRVFGSKVYKIPVSTAESCPNREGLKGMQTCIFCDPWGSAARVESLKMSLRDQIEQFRARIFELYKAEKFLVYFQAYTNTFAKAQSIREQFETALEFDFVHGLVVGTRPDCLSKAVLEMWAEYAQKTFLSVELGVQSFDDRQMDFLRRGHTVQQSLKAIERIQQYPKVDLGIHLMFGLPGETDRDMIQAARICNDLPISNVKLHNLHVLKDTPLADLYEKGKFQPIGLEQYADRVRVFLQHLRPEIAVHRLTALSSRREELVAPEWTAQKMYAYQFCVDHLQRQDAFQGQFFEPGFDAHLPN